MKAIIRNREDVQKAIQFLNSLDLKFSFEITVVKSRTKRTLPQNKLLWKWMKCVAEETGDDEDSLYQYFCQKYLPWRATICFGEETNSSGGSSTLNTKEFTDFLDKISRQMQSIGIYLPHPGDLGWDEFNQRF